MNTWPVLLPFPEPVPPSLLPTASMIESLSTRFSPRVPDPVPVDAVTVKLALSVAAFGVTFVIAGVPPSPLLTSEKSLGSTPFTASLNVTVHCTEAAFVGDGPARLIEVTVGA